MWSLSDGIDFHVEISSFAKLQLILSAHSHQLEGTVLGLDRIGGPFLYIAFKNRLGYLSMSQDENFSECMEAVRDAAEPFLDPEVSVIGFRYANAEAEISAENLVPITRWYAAIEEIMNTGGAAPSLSWTLQSRAGRPQRDAGI